MPPEVFKWLRAEAAVDGGRPQGGMVELPEPAGACIMSGQTVAHILSGRFHELGGEPAGGDPAAEARLIKQLAAQRGQGAASGNAPSERLYSWNMLSPVLARLGVNLSADDKTLIVAGDEEVRCICCLFFPCAERLLLVWTVASLSRKHLSLMCCAVESFPCVPLRSYPLAPPPPLP